jgi:hypothetical protein
MTQKDADSIVNWLLRKSAEFPFGDLTITVKLHAGRPSLIERSYCERVKTTGNTGTNHDETRR